MDQTVRNKLRNLVTQCRKLLEEAVAQVLQGQFGIYAGGKKDEVHVDDESRLTNLSEKDKGYRRDIIAHLEHIQALGYSARDALAQLVREIAFTHLNRLCAYKMMEAREVWVSGQRFREAVSRGMKSQGFQFYLADHADDKKLFDTGQQDVAYRHFLGWLGGLLSEEIGVLFSPTDPANRLFPPQRVLDDVLALLNSDDLKDIWAEDETIGWVYQYFTPKELRDQVRKESAAPRNSYELAFRNQFFTPRYVVEFLTDNTLGRIWYEMRKGDTKLKEQCRYMVRRPSEIFLDEGQSPPEPTPNQEGLSQEELLKQPVHIPHRPRKDPRELRILDPACGSGHFLLYCFFLLLTIYEEAYDDPEFGPKLKEDYPTLDDLRRDVPRLILAHNLYGIDIDLRATQIAALALWLRCQRAYKEMGLKQDRPRITKSNIVCAEPMPGEKALLDEFLKTLKQDRLETLIRRVMQVPEGSRVRATEAMAQSLTDLVRLVWDKMQLAGEAGSLLKIEEELQEAVRKGQEEWEEKQPLFRVTQFGLTEESKESYVRLVPGEGVSFWARAEALVLEALRDYARHAANGGRLQRQLFADDAERGFAFIDTCQKRFDVVLMNPPFGSLVLASKERISIAYPECKDDLDAMFVARAAQLLLDQGMSGQIANRTEFFKGGLSEWRQRFLLTDPTLVLAADLGYGVLDTAVVEAAAYVLTRSIRSTSAPLFLRLLKSEDKSHALNEQIQSVQRGREAYEVFSCRVSTFSRIPERRLAYWISPSIRRAFERFPSFEGNVGAARQGLASADNFRFVRLAWEVPCTEIGRKLDEFVAGAECRSRTWAFFAKGGEYQPYFQDFHLVVNWADDGAELRNYHGSVIRNPTFYFKPALTYSERTASGFSPRMMPPGCLFDSKGPIMAVYSPDLLAPLLGIAMSRVVASMLELMVAAGDAAFSGSAARQYTQGIVGAIPVPPIGDEAKQRLTNCVHRIWVLRREADSENETSRYFTSCGVFNVQKGQSSSSSLRQRVNEGTVQNENRHLEILSLSWEVEKVVRELYGLDPLAIREIDDDFGQHPCCLPDADLSDSELARLRQLLNSDIDAVIDGEVQASGGNRAITKKSYFADRKLELLSAILGKSAASIARARQRLGFVSPAAYYESAVSLISQAVGVAVGRWDIRIAQSFADHVAPLGGPDEPLPIIPPGMLKDGTEIPASGHPHDYPLRIDWDGIMPDDEDHIDDTVRRVREVFEVVWKDRADAIEQESCEILGVKELRDYFRKPGKGGFWDDHVSRYSKSRRKAPIYWLLQSSKKNYALWLYYHRLDRDILFKARKNYVDPKIRLEQSRLDSLRSQKAGLGAAAKGARKIDKDIERQEALLSELTDFAEKLERAAKLNFGSAEKLSSDVVYDPDLNDGVVLNIAPLWELVPWKEAKNYWEELLDGKYEWSSMGKLLRMKGLVR